MHTGAVPGVDARSCPEWLAPRPACDCRCTRTPSVRVFAPAPRARHGACALQLHVGLPRDASAALSPRPRPVPRPRPPPRPASSLAHSDPIPAARLHSHHRRLQPLLSSDLRAPRAAMAQPYLHNNASGYSHAGYAQDPYDASASQGAFFKQEDSSNYYLDAGSGYNHPYAPHESSERLAGAPSGDYAQPKYSYSAPTPSAKRPSKWLTIFLPLVAVVVIAAAVLGGYFGSRASKKHESTGANAASEGGSTQIDDPALNSLASSHAAAGSADKLFTGSTDVYGNPMFLKSANLAAPAGNGKTAVACNDDASGLSMTNLRAHPRLMAPGYMWDCLPQRIQKDAYLTAMNDSVFSNASAWYSMPPTNYSIDGGYAGSGVLDVSRQVQQRVRAWAYAYRMTKDSKWSDRAWKELVTAAGNTSQPFGQGPAPLPDQHWNPVHFLDTSEMTAAFAIGYDWLHDVWNATQLQGLRWSIITLGLKPGLSALQGNGTIGWWAQASNGGGNWNCVSNSGLLLGALAISGDDGDDPDKTGSQVLDLALANITGNCFQGPYSDGTWAETPNYWYFGTNAAVRAESSLVTATGSNQGVNPDFYKTGYFHMYVSGMAGMMAYGDHGPNKYSTNANGMLWWGNHYKQPLLTLFQRDRADALGDPLALFWYDTSATGAFWNSLPLDRYFPDVRGSWMSMRSSWTDFTGLFVAMKASNLTGHQTHGDLDVGDFVIDALGTRFIGEYGSAQYLSPGYFTSETETAQRWTYYRKGTAGQNTLLVDGANQQVNCAPHNKFDTTNKTQSSEINFHPSKGDNAYFITDMSSAYNQTSGKMVRGIRVLNARRQVLLRDEVAAGVGKSTIEWRVQTNATISLSGSNATLTISNLTDPNAAFELDYTFAKPKVMNVSILSPPGATFNVEGPPAGSSWGPGAEADGLPGNPTNVGVSVLKIDLKPGSAQTIEVLFQPQWDGLTSADQATPPSVPLSGWTLTSHD